MLKVEDLPSPSPAWDHLLAVPFHHTALSPFPSLPSSKLSASSVSYLLHDHTRGERRSIRRWASQSQHHLQVYPGKDPVELQHEILHEKAKRHAGSKCMPQFSSVFHNSEGRQIWLSKNDYYFFWALLEFNTANNVSVACSLGHNSKQGTYLEGREGNWTTSCIGTWVPPHWYKTIHLKAKKLHSYSFSFGNKSRLSLWSS